MLISDSVIMEVMCDYYRRHMADTKSVAYPALWEAFDVLKNSGILTTEDYDCLVKLDNFLSTDNYLEEA